MRYEHITLYVKDLERSLSFYRDLMGLNLLRRISTENIKIVFLGKADQPSIELIEAGGNAPEKSGFSLGFRVESLDEATTMMEAAGNSKLVGFVMKKQPFGLRKRLILFLLLSLLS
ncbi:MAG: VOC family protein, partial [bacterium]|nr:VOC family protein [bacterium]